MANRYFLCAWVVLTGICTAWAEDQIQTYTVTKEHPSVATAASATPDIPVNASPIHWTTPRGWQELPPTSVRIANFAILGKSGKAGVAVTSFPGQVGTELDNVNRWRRELQLPPIEQADISSQPVTVDASEGKLFDIRSATERTVVALVRRNDATWFFKLRGESQTVEAAQPAFIEFLKSIQFADGGNAVSAATSADSAPGPAAGGEDSPKWNVPANWNEIAPGAMVFKRFTAGEGAEVTVSFFQGDVGGLLANINRWRGQVSLQPVEESGLAAVTESEETPGGKAVFVDFTGTTKAGEPARLVGAIVPHGENTWFYKLLGSTAGVSKEKEAFENFVKTVQYP